MGYGGKNVFFLFNSNLSRRLAVGTKFQIHLIRDRPGLKGLVFDGCLAAIRW